MRDEKKSKKVNERENENTKERYVEKDIKVHQYVKKPIVTINNGTYIRW